jgi:hypothetical protein
MEHSQTVQSKETADGTDARKAPFDCAMIQMAPILGTATTVLAKTLDNASNCIVWNHTEALMMNRIDVFYVFSIGLPN